MANLRHPNILALIGVCTRGVPKLVVIPYCAHGSLQELLEMMGAKLHLDAKLDACHGIACGLAYLAANHLVHRDVAARNVLVDDEFNCRICDFGVRACVVMVAGAP